MGVHQAALLCCYDLDTLCHEEEGDGCQHQTQPLQGLGGLQIDALHAESVGLVIQERGFDLHALGVRRKGGQAGGLITEDAPRGSSGKGEPHVERERTQILLRPQGDAMQAEGAPDRRRQRFDGAPVMARAVDVIRTLEAHAPMPALGLQPIRASSAKPRSASRSLG